MILTLQIEVQFVLHMYYILFSLLRRILQLQLLKKFVQIMQKGYFRKTIQPIERNGYNTSRSSDDGSFKSVSDEDPTQNCRQNVKTTPLT